MTTDPRQEVETLRSRIEAGDRDVSDTDADVLIDFSKQMDLLKEEYSNHRHVKLLRHCTRMAEEVGGLADALEDRDAAEDIVRWIQTTYDNEETNRDYRVALRVFGKRVNPDDDGDPPASIAWVSSKTSRSYDPSPDPADMLELEEDIKPMIEETANPRDAALIGVQYEGGFRGGELYNLTVGDVSDADHGIHIRVDGKTGERTVLLAGDFSIPPLQRWLNDRNQGHPAPGDPDAPLWSKLNKPERYSYQRFYQCFKEAADRADVTKTVHPTNFRKSNAYWLAKQRDAKASLIEDRQGRRRGSEAAARYIAKFGEATDAQYARLQGKEVETSEPESHAPVECPRCGQDTPHDRDECVFCGQALEYDSESLEQKRQEQQEVRRAVLRLAKENPDILDEIEQAQSLMDLFEQHPELEAEAQQFVKALSTD